MRPVQAEPAERKHRRRRCRRQGGASRTSSACAPTTRHPRRRKTDGQRPCRQRAHSKRACTQQPQLAPGGYNCSKAPKMELAVTYISRPLITARYICLLLWHFLISSCNQKQQLLGTTAAPTCSQTASTIQQEAQTKMRDTIIRAILMEISTTFTAMPSIS